MGRGVPAHVHAEAVLSALLEAHMLPNIRLRQGKSITAATSMVSRPAVTCRWLWTRLIIMEVAPRCTA